MEENRNTDVIIRKQLLPGTERHVITWKQILSGTETKMLLFGNNSYQSLKLLKLIIVYQRQVIVFIF